MAAITPVQIKKIWATATELGLDRDDLYSIIYRETKKESMKLLTKFEANKVIDSLVKPIKSKRTDTGGNVWTKEQRQKVYKLTEELGWNNNNARINGFVKKMFKVERIEWLDGDQCSRLIEMLKKMLDRSV